MKERILEASPNLVPLRLGAAVAIVAVVHIAVIVFVFLKAVRMNSDAKP